MRRSLTALLLLALLLPACGKAETSPSYTGKYDLVTVDGNQLPYTPSHEGGAPEILSGDLTLNPDGSFQMSLSFSGTQGKPEVHDFSGTYSLDQDTFRFQWEGAGVTPGTLAANVVTINNEGILFAFQK